MFIVPDIKRCYDNTFCISFLYHGQKPDTEIVTFLPLYEQKTKNIYEFDKPSIAVAVNNARTHNSKIKRVSIIIRKCI